jgi:hypothetical protein
MSAWDHFTIELCGDRELAPSVGDINRALTALDLEADGSPDAERMFEAVMWICRQREHPLRERVQKISELVALKGRQVIDLKAFCGW